MRYLSLILIFLSALCFANGDSRSPEQQKIEFLEQRVQELRTENQKLSDKFDKIDETIKKAVEEKTTAYDKLNSQSVASFNNLVSLLQAVLIIASFLIAVLTWVGWNNLSNWIQTHVRDEAAHQIKAQITDEFLTSKIDGRVSDDFLASKIDGKSQAAMDRLDADVAAKAEQLFVRYENELKERLADATKDAAAIAELKQQHVEQELTPQQQASVERLEAKAEQIPPRERTEDHWFMLGLHAWKHENHLKALEYFEQTTTANGLGNAAVAADRLQQYAKAEELYLRAIETDPKVSHHLLNYAELLFVQKRRNEGKHRLTQAEQSETCTDETKLGINLCRFAFLEDEQSFALGQLKALLQSGTRSTGYSCISIIDDAQKTSHSELELLKHLVLVINDKVKLDVLNQYPAWQNA